MQRIDASNMQELLERFPDQIEEARRLGENVQLRMDASGISTIVITGLGGSAIGGDLLRSYLAGELRVPFLINRHYFLPNFVAGNSLVIVSSYSGNTEETIAAHREAIGRGAKLLCITSNGETERISEEHGNALIKIPRGLPPRAALGYSFFPILMVLVRLGFIKERSRDVEETVALLKEKARVYSDRKSSSNDTLRIAKELQGKLPVIYSATEHLDSVNLRWRTQLAENAKVLAFGNTIPEMNHNELVGWSVLKRIMERIAVVFLRDGEEHPRVRVRLELTGKIIGRYSPHIFHVQSEGKSLLARMFSLIYFGDWVSYHLALLNRVDPTPVKVIDYLKTELGKV